MFVRFSTVLRLMALALALFVADRASAQTVVTFEKVLEYVQLEVSEAKIIRLVEASPTQMVLGAQQIDTLRQAGATPTLIEALQKRGQTVVQPQSDVTEFVVILDCSGSMNDRLPDGASKWEAAKHAAIDLVNSIPEGRNLAFIVYGRDALRQCASVDLIRPLRPLSAQEKPGLSHLIDSFKAVGHTPIARSLRMAGEQLQNASGMASVVLITDGMETCHADPAAEAARLVAAFSNLRATVNVIGFCLGEFDADKVSRIAQAGNGNFYDAKNAAELVNSVRTVERVMIAPRPAEVVQQPVATDVLSPIERLMIEQLNDPSMDVREAAAKTIKERKIAAAVPALINLMVNAPWGTGLWGDLDRNAAIEALLDLAPEQAGPAIAATLQSKSWKVRNWAANMIVIHRITDAIPAAETRLLAMEEKDVQPTLINGADEANKLFEAVQTLAPERLETLVVKLMKSEARSVRVWATDKLSEVK